MEHNGYIFLNIRFKRIKKLKKYPITDIIEKKKGKKKEGNFSLKFMNWRMYVSLPNPFFFLQVKDEGKTKLKMD